LPVAERVVNDLAGPLTAHRRHADDVEDARPLGPGPHHAVERGQLADGVRGQEHRTAAHAGVAVSPVGRVPLLGTADPADRLAGCGRVAELEGEVPGDAEAVGDPLAREPSDDVVRDGRSLTHRMVSGWETGQWRPPQSNARTKPARRNLPGGPRPKDRLQAF